MNSCLIQMGEMYTKVGSAKKLPVVVEEVGRRVFSVNGAVLQRQVKFLLFWGSVRFCSEFG